MLEDDDWDLVADNIAFIQQSVPGASSMQPAGSNRTPGFYR